MAWSHVVNHRVGRYGVRVLGADWKRRGLAAGPIRNAEIVAGSDWGVAFWDGKVQRSGTLDTVRKFIAAGKCVVVIWRRKNLSVPSYARKVRR